MAKGIPVILGNNQEEGYLIVQKYCTVICETLLRYPPTVMYSGGLVYWIGSSSKKSHSVQNPTLCFLNRENLVKCFFNRFHAILWRN